MEIKEELAIHGGKPVVSKEMTKFTWPIITSKDKKAVLKVLEDAERGVPLWGISPPQIDNLQREWAKYVGRKYCIFTNSGTSSLHMAVAAAGIGPGDEVITSAFTFIASATCVLHHNGIPVFVDIDPETALMDTSLIEEKITPRTKAIIPVHIHGLPADMDEIMKIARKYNLVVIEDACQAPGSLYKGKKVGSIGDMAAFSLNGCKHLTCGEGGFFVTNKREFHEKADMVRCFGEVLKKRGALYDIGCYLVNVSRFITNKEPMKVFAMQEVHTRFGVDISTTAILNFSGSIFSLCNCSFGTIEEDFYEVIGDRGKLRVEKAFVIHKTPVVITITTGKKAQKIKFPVINPYTCEIDYFVNCIKNGRLIPPAEDGVENMKVIDALFLSAQSHREIHLKIKS